MFAGCGISSQIPFDKTCHNFRTKNDTGMKLELQTKHEERSMTLSKKISTMTR